MVPAVLVRLAPLAAACLVPAAAAAQSWRLEPHSAAVYERALRAESTREPADGNMPLPWIARHNPGFVLHSDLDASRERVDRPITDLRDAFAVACMDLSVERRTKPRIMLPATARYAPSVLELQWSAPDPAGLQQVSGTIEVDEKARRRARRGGDAAHTTVTGTVRGERVVDADNGRVQRLRGHLDLRFERAAHGEVAAAVTTWSIDDQWTFDCVLGWDSPEFRTRVTDAISSGADGVREHLRRCLDREVQPVEDPYHDHQPGSLALLLLALVKATEDPDDGLLQRGYERLRESTILGTYELAVAILAVEALHTPPGEWRALREGTIDRPMPRQLDAADLALVQRWTERLLGNVDQTVDRAYLRRWHYGPSEHWDNSNTQYALLGLYAAQLCGVEVSAQVWQAAAAHWLDVRRPGGAAAAVELLTHAQREARRDGSITRSRGRRVEPIGWAYDAGGEPTGSMTCAGLTGLVLCKSALRRLRKGTAKQLREIDAAIQGGFAWLAQHLDVRDNPGAPSSWHYYYLYGLERSCELEQLALLGDRDWYFEGALQLIGQQERNGTWGSDWDTCFATLFLKKSALPVVTGR